MDWLLLLLLRGAAGLGGGNLDAGRPHLVRARGRICGRGYAGAALANQKVWERVAFMTGRVFNPAEAEVRLYTRSGCHLCDEAKRELRKLQQQVPFEFSEIDIDQDAALRERYNDEVPVIFIHGSKAFKYRIEPREFSRILRQGPEET